MTAWKRTSGHLMRHLISFVWKEKRLNSAALTDWWFCLNVKENMSMVGLWVRSRFYVCHFLLVWDLLLFPLWLHIKTWQQQDTFLLEERFSCSLLSSSSPAPRTLSLLFSRHALNNLLCRSRQPVAQMTQCVVCHGSILTVKHQKITLFCFNLTLSYIIWFSTF